MSKSFTSIETKMCLVTGKEYQTNGILLDKKLKNSMEMQTCTGWGISPEAQEQINKGFVALIGADSSKSTITNGKVLPENVYRTGEIAYLRREVFNNLMPDYPADTPLAYVDPAIIHTLQEMQQNTSEEQN